MSEDKDNKNVDADYEYSRKTYYELIEKSKETLDLMADVARESEHPRAFEVFGNMVKQIADVNDKLMDVNAKLKKVTGWNPSNDGFKSLLVGIEKTIDWIKNYNFSNIKSGYSI